MKKGKEKQLKNGEKDNKKCKHDKTKIGHFF